MGEQELGKCIFCNQEKAVERLYVFPSKYVKPTDIVEACKLYNEGDYFHYVTYCSDCGIPKVKDFNPFDEFIKALKSDTEMQRAYKDNIAMAFKDNFIEGRSLHKNANIASEHFINLLINI